MANMKAKVERRVTVEAQVGIVLLDQATGRLQSVSKRALQILRQEREIQDEGAFVNYLLDLFKISSFKDLCCERSILVRELNKTYRVETVLDEAFLVLKLTEIYNNEQETI